MSAQPLRLAPLEVRPKAHRFKLTKTTVDARCLPPRVGEVTGKGKAVQQRIYWDDELAGFGVVVGQRTKSYILQRDLHGRSVRVTIGRHGVWTPDMARKRARELTVEMDRGNNPNEQAREDAARGVVLDEVIGMHEARMKARRAQAGSIALFRDEMARLLSDWMRRPVAEISPNDCAKRHERLTKENGPYIANRVMAQFRAVYNTARKRMRDLPPNPVDGVTFNELRRRREPVDGTDLAAWNTKVLALGNPVRRDLQLLILFTGLRSTDAKTVRWEHVDFDHGTLHRPKPKGGEDRAFTIPVAKCVLEMLQARQAENKILFDAHGGDGGWAFPTLDNDGKVSHVVEVKEQRVTKKKKYNHLPSPHRLRDTFATACHEAGLTKLDTKVLMNHSLASGDVTEGYIRQGMEHLRECVEKVAAHLRKKMAPNK